MKSLRVISAALALLFAAQAARAQDENKAKELPRFHKINAGLYRGAQPSQEGFERLVALGIKTIINLRDNDERALEEEKEARALGFNYFNIPLDIFHKPSDLEVERILGIISAPEYQPVFVHCKRGRDRTGLVIAAYRIALDGWTNKQAEDEAKRHGLPFWQFKMKSYIRDYKRRSEPKAPVSRWRLEQSRAVFV